MGQISIQKFKRTKVSSSFPNPEIFLEGEEIGNDIKFFINLKFSESIKSLSKDSLIKLYPTSKQGVVYLPYNLGTVDNISIKEDGYTIKNEKKDNLYFNLKISTPKSHVDGFAYRIKFKNKNQGEGEVDIEESTQQSILPVIEDPNQTIPFKIIMHLGPGEPPTLSVRTGLKNKMKSSAITQYSITTSAIRTIISNYILDSDSVGEKFRDKWELLIQNLIDDNNYKFPSRLDALDRSGTLKNDVEDDIEDVIIQFGRKRKFRGSQLSLNDAFLNELSLTNEDEVQENDPA